MTEVVTYIRCQINGKWTNLGIIAEEDEIKEHFEYVEDLMKEKQRADELEKRWAELKEFCCKNITKFDREYHKTRDLRHDGMSSAYEEAFYWMKKLEEDGE